MGKYKIHAYLRITQSTFFYYSLIRLDKKGFLQPGNVCHKNQQSLKLELVLLERTWRVHPLHSFSHEILNYRHSESLLLQFSSSVHVGRYYPRASSLLIILLQTIPPPSIPITLASPAQLLSLSDDLLAKNRHFVWSGKLDSLLP